MTDSDSETDDDGVDWRRVANGIGLLVLLVVVGLFLSTAVPQAVGSDHSYVVQSGSMSPAIQTGSVVFVSEVPTDTITEGDVITFERGDVRVTHRVFEVVERDGDRRFRTKGDANEDPDPESVPRSAVIGVVDFHVPAIGYVTSYTHTRLGIVALVVVPAILLVLSELWDLVRTTPTPTTSDEGDDCEQLIDHGGSDEQ